MRTFAQKQNQAPQRPTCPTARSGGKASAASPQAFHGDLRRTTGNRAGREDRDRDIPAPSVVYRVFSSPGRALAPDVRSLAEARLGHDFGRVRVHADAGGALSQWAGARGAAAYTVGSRVVFAPGQYAPQTRMGLGLLGHELAHTVQQREAGSPLAAAGATSRRALETEADASGAALASPVGGPVPIRGTVGTCLQCDNGRGSRLEVRSPVLEETIRQGTAVMAEIAGRPLRRAERELAQSVFGNGIDYSQVRVVESERLGYGGPPNTITVPVGFEINVARAAGSWHDLPTERFIHEMVHVWQYQHGGTGYISDALLSNMGSLLSSGRRARAYAYTIVPGRRFFEYSAEQQAQIVTDYFWASLRLAHAQWLTPEHRADMEQRVRRVAPLIEQLRSAIPRTRAEQVEDRVRDLMRPLGPELSGTGFEEGPTVRPLVEFRFDIGL